MDGQSASVYIVGFLTQKIEELAVDHGDQEIECAVRVGHDEKQHRLSVPGGEAERHLPGGNNGYGVVG